MDKWDKDEEERKRKSDLKRRSDFGGLEKDVGGRENNKESTRGLRWRW